MGKTWPLRDLNARFSAVVENWTPETGGTPTGRYQVMFLCPICRTHEVSVYERRARREQKNG